MKMVKLEPVKQEEAGSEVKKMVKMEPGESSENEPWAKLVALHDDDDDSKQWHSDIYINSDEMIVSSPPPGHHQWFKISRNSDLCSATLINLSLTTMIVDGRCVDMEDTVVLKCGTDILLDLHNEGYFCFRFRVMAVPENSQKHLKIRLEPDHAKCSICLHIWHDVVTVSPCLHNFCNGCFSEWLRMSEKNNSSIPCPQCRADVHSVGRNHFLRNIEEGVLESDPSLKRATEDLAVLDRYASIQSHLVIRTGSTRCRKRPYSPPSEEAEHPCPQCGSSFGGFQCNQSTSHLQCHACGGMMPARSDSSVPQQCLGCDRAFCWGYWRSLGVHTSDSHTVCRHENFKPISEYVITRFPSLTHENNQFEQDITGRCIRQMGKTLQNVISDWISKLDNRELDRTRMPLNHAEMISSATHVCKDCYEKLVSFLLYWFRITIPKSNLPPDMSSREDCWYGYTCRTQRHSEEHARKRNHVCRPTRGSGMP